ncbi:MAG: glycosyltransferase [Bacteroidales bacterium]|nr:glycosyltransferase [Bacteroidales bacterium]
MEITSFFDNISTSEWIIIGLYLIFFIVQLFYYLYLYRKPYQHAANNSVVNDTTSNSDEELPGISIIISAKNEAENLRNNLPFILNQQYPNFEVVVVDNASTDSTSDVLESFCSNYPNLYTTFIPIGSHALNNKKLALTLGIKAAKHEIILFTEPDTKPLSSKWVYEYAKAFNKEKSVVLGCCQLKIEKGFFKKYILFDNLISGIKYTSMALAKKPYMGIGRNMAFRKKLFFDNKGFSSVLNMEDGEDNVFINRIATKENTALVSSPDSMVISNVIDSFSSWRSIKTTYLTTRKHYIGNTANILSFETFSRYAFYMLFVTLSVIAIKSSLTVIALFTILLFLIRYVIQLLIVNKNSKVYNAGNFYFSLPLLDLAIPIVNHLFLTREKKRSDILSERK